MKYVIPRGRTVEKLSDNIISTKQIDTRKIIVVTKRTIYKTDRIYILTQASDNYKWHLSSIEMSQNLLYLHREANPITLLDKCNYIDDHIYQFDDLPEFVRWLAKKLCIKDLKEPTTIKRDRLGRFCSSKPKII